MRKKKVSQYRDLIFHRYAIKSMAKKSMSLNDYQGNLQKRWYFMYTDPDTGERKKREVPGFADDTEEERRARAADLMAQLSQQMPASPSEAKDKIIAYLETRKHLWRKKTYQTESSKANMFFRWLGPKSLSKATVAEFFADYLLGTRRVNATTYNNYLVCMGKLFLAVGPDYTKGIKPLKAKKQPYKYFSQQQVQHIVPVLEQNEPTVHKAVRLLYYCFIRPGEIRQLTVGDVQLDSLTIRVPANVSKNKTTQEVCIPDPLVAMVRDMVANRAPNEYLLHMPGQPYTMVTTKFLSERHQNLIASMGYDTKVYKLYSWKHTGNVHAVHSGVPLKLLQIQNRHHSLDQTDQYLRQMGANDLGELARKFPSLA